MLIKVGDEASHDTVPDTLPDTARLTLLSDHFVCQLCQSPLYSLEGRHLSRGLALLQGMRPSPKSWATTLFRRNIAKQQRRKLPGESQGKQKRTFFWCNALLPYYCSLFYLFFVVPFLLFIIILAKKGLERQNTRGEWVRLRINYVSNLFTK